MLKISGKYNEAVVYANEVEETAKDQIIELCNQQFTAGWAIRMMPDLHAGVGCVIGTTIDLKENKKIVPNLIGVDIGCGVRVVHLGKVDIDFDKLENFIRTNIPTGFHVRSKPHRLLEETRLRDLCCYSDVYKPKHKLAIGTLGSGNHFIEIDKDNQGNKYLLIHTGSRNLGFRIANFWQRRAIETIGIAKIKYREDVIAHAKKTNEEGTIQDRLKGNFLRTPPEALCYLEGVNFDGYMMDMKVAQEYAELNRKAIAEVIIEGMGFTPIHQFSSVHNYIEDSRIIRKGAVSAKEGERLIIPINMRDGALLCAGLGNKDANYSAPHGAGRLYSRGDAKRKLSMATYESEMSEVYTTSVTPETLDECAGAYKPIEEIIKNIDTLVTVTEHIVPVYSLKDIPEKRRRRR